ncbi:MAG: acyltransferase family protein [Bdellovibrio sp.]
MLQKSELQTRHYVYSLDILRSIAILLVMCWHLPKEIKFAIAPISQIGLWGVDLFFVLSGFLIANQFFSQLIRKNNFAFRSFYIKRILRTWPCFFTVLAFYLMLPNFWEHSYMPPFWRFVTFTQNFDLKLSAFSQAWSLCIEEQFYLLFPIVSFITWRSKSVRLVVAVIVGLLLLGLLVRALMWFTFMADLTTNSERQYQYFSKIYYPTWSRLDGLILGVSIAATKNFATQLWKQLTSYGDWLLFSGFLILLVGFWLHSDRYSLSAALFGFPVVSLGFGGIILSALSPGSALNRLKTPGADLIAMLSYSLYLLHKQIFHLSAIWISKFEIQNVFVKAVFMFAMSVLSAGALHLIIERPFLTLREKITNKL